MSSYVDYYQRSRTHLSLEKDCPVTRPVQPRNLGRVVAIPAVTGLHHRYQRLAALTRRSERSPFAREALRGRVISGSLY
jgi:hypothetical protein